MSCLVWVLGTIRLAHKTLAANVRRLLMLKVTMICINCQTLFETMVAASSKSIKQITGDDDAVSSNTSHPLNRHATGLVHYVNDAHLSIKKVRNFSHTLACPFTPASPVAQTPNNQIVHILFRTPRLPHNPPIFARSRQYYNTSSHLVRHDNHDDTFVSCLSRVGMLDGTVRLKL